MAVPLRQTRKWNRLLKIVKQCPCTFIHGTTKRRPITSGSSTLIYSIKNNCLNKNRHNYSSMSAPHLHSNHRLSIFHPSTKSYSSCASNPLLELQSFTSEPILEKREVIFAPSQADVATATKLFIPSARHKISFVKGAYYPEQAPSIKLPEIAFIGRSNVGKSSLLKAIFSEVPGLTVRTSKIPGFTKLLLFFQVGNHFSLVDMPGYGYNQPENFITSVEGFLTKRKNLRNTFLLIDSSVGPLQWDLVAIAMLEEFSIPYLMVLTKSDKASRRQLITNIMATKTVIRERTHACLPQPFLVSAKSGVGIPFLKSFVAYTTGNLVLEQP